MPWCPTVVTNNIFFIKATPTIFTRLIIIVNEGFSTFRPIRLLALVCIVAFSMAFVAMNFTEEFLSHFGRKRVKIALIGIVPKEETFFTIW